MYTDMTFHELLRGIEDLDLHVNYIQIRQHGQIIFDYHRPAVRMRLNTWSVSKSFVSMAVGIALDEGLIMINEKLVDSFQEYLPKDNAGYLSDITIRHLLTMTSGLKNPLFFTDEPERVIVQDWVSHFFQAQFVNVPGTKFLYTNFTAYMLACLLERKVNMDLMEYLKPRLFTPLEIYSPDWTRCPAGHLHASNGLNLNIDEMANFGEMILNNGSFNGKRIVSEEYIKAATNAQVDTGKGLMNQYGYLFWIDTKHNCIRADGRYGQYILILPGKDAVIAVQSLEEREFYPLVMDLVENKL